MLHGNGSIVKHKIGLLNLAEELTNVSRACKIMGLSRDTFYRVLSVRIPDDPGHRFHSIPASNSI